MSPPTAVSPTVRSTGVAVSVNMFAGARSPGTGALKVLLLGVKTTAGGGTITADTQLERNVSGPDAVSTLLGSGSLGHLASKAIFTEYGLAQVDVAAPAEPAGVAASKTFTFASTPIVAQTVTGIFHGRSIALTWLASEAAATFVARFVAAVNAKSSDLFVIASNPSGADFKVTAKAKGTCGNDVYAVVKLTDGSGGTVDASTESKGYLTSGTLACDPTNVLGLVVPREYDFILCCESNAEAIANSATSVYGKIQTHINTYNTGLAAKLQQQIVGCTDTQANALVGSNARNSPWVSMKSAQKFQSLPCEVAGAELGQRLREVSTYPVKNRCLMEYLATLYPPYDPVTYALSAAQVEAALQGGLSPVQYTEAGKCYPRRPITTYWVDALSAADDRALDVTRSDGILAVTKDVRAELGGIFLGKSLSKDVPEGADTPPPDVIQERAAKTAAIGRMRFWATTRGVLDSAKLEASIANGEVIAQIDPSDGTQFDFVLPMATIKIAAKVSIVANQVG